MSAPGMLTMRRARQLEAVHRAISMGLHAAADQLSFFVGQRITIEAPRLGLCPIEQLVECALGIAFEEVPTRMPDAMMTGLYLGMDGDVTGHFLLLLAPSDAQALVAPLIEEVQPPPEQREAMIQSALGEVGNITASGLLNALADATKLRIFPSCPAVVTDMAGAILEMPLLDIAQVAEEALYIETSIMMAGFSATGSVALIPHPSGLEMLVQALAPPKPGRRKR
ncbi:MAG: chemotaxis protein CheC [Ktedonobacterales bacterium]|nr:chemotaxis protein CheC [Ktedonobacterales bacterium]